MVSYCPYVLYIYIYYEFALFVNITIKELTCNEMILHYIRNRVDMRSIRCRIPIKLPAFVSPFFLIIGYTSCL